MDPLYLHTGDVCSSKWHSRSSWSIWSVLLQAGRAIVHSAGDWDTFTNLPLCTEDSIVLHIPASQSHQKKEASTSFPSE